MSTTNLAMCELKWNTGQLNDSSQHQTTNQVQTIVEEAEERLVKRFKRNLLSEEFDEVQLRRVSTQSVEVVDVDVVAKDWEVNDPEICRFNGLPAQELAFSIELIFEEILKNLPPSSLKYCRLVSHRWNTLASKRLENLTRIKIYTEKDYDSEYYSYGFIKEVITPSGFEINKMEPLRNLLSVLHQNSPAGNSFPCNHFAFFKSKLSVNVPDVHNFFLSHGDVIKTLELNIFYPKLDKEHLKSDIDFIIENCPNLENLTLSSNITETWALKMETENAETDLFKSPVKSRSKVSKLKKLKFLSVFPKQIIEFLTTESVGSLAEISVHIKNLNFFLLSAGDSTETPILDRNPVLQRNKIHLLKSLDFEPTHDNLQVYEKLSLDKNLNLEKFSFNLTWIYSWEVLWSRVAGVLSRILEGSKDTLVEITWDSTRFLGSSAMYPCLVLPGVLKKVRKLNLSIGKLTMLMLGPPENKRFFPEGLQISKTFPGLKEVQLINGRPIYEFNFEKYFESQDNRLEVVSSVRKLQIQHFNYYDPESCRKFMEMFPNVSSSENNSSY